MVDVVYDSIEVEGARASRVIVKERNQDPYQAGRQYSLPVKIGSSWIVRISSFDSGSATRLIEKLNAFFV